MTIVIMSREPRDFLFDVLIDWTSMERWSLERIKYEVGNGAVLTEREEAA